MWFKCRSMADARDYKPEVASPKSEAKSITPAFLNTGVPHAVLFVSDADKVFDVAVLGRKALRFHKVFGAKRNQRELLYRSDRPQRSFACAHVRERRRSGKRLPAARA